MLTCSIVVMSTHWNAPPSLEGVEGWVSVWLTGNESGHWVWNVALKPVRKKRGGRLWQTDCTYWAIRVRLISWLSFHRTVICPGSPLCKSFKYELIDVIVLKMTELLWYYRTHLTFPLWVNNELNGNWQNVAIQREETVVRESDERQQEGKKKVE